MNDESTLLRRVSLAATLALTSHAEYAAGVASGLPLWHPFGADHLPLGLPWLLPVAIDCYVVDALERRKGADRWAALGILAMSVVGGSAYTAVDWPGRLKAAGVGVILVLVLSRLYTPPRLSRADTAMAAAVDAQRKAADDREREALLVREREASRLRIAEARETAEAEAGRIRAVADAEAMRLRVEMDAQQAAAELAERSARAITDQVRAQAEADALRVHAESAATVARIAAEAEAARLARASKESAKRPATQSTRPAPAPSVDPPSRDGAARMVASAIRDHDGPEPYVFDWQAWSSRHGGGRSFWFAAKAAAERGPHLAEAAS